jgi:phage terminase small subunit
MEKKKNYKLTPKQEKFAMKYIELGNATDAYREAYDAYHLKIESANRNAYKLLANVKIMSLINKIKADHMTRHAITVDSLIEELEEARQVALSAETPQSSAAVSATMGKAKLCGLDKRIIELSGTIQTRDISDEVLSEKLAALGLGRFVNQLSEKIDDDE